MNSISIAPTQWANFLDIDQVNPLNSQDSDCLSEIYQVLNRYGCADRFGITLLHKHFNIESDEVLVEETDKENRVLTIRPVKADQVSGYIETNWQLIGNESKHCMAVCRTFCKPDERGFHVGPLHVDPKR